MERRAENNSPTAHKAPPAKAVALVAQVFPLIRPGVADGPACIYTSERGVDGRGVAGVLGDAPHARAGFEIVIVVLLLPSYVALLLQCRLRRGHKLRDETTRTRPSTQRCTANRAEHWFIVSRSSCRTSARKAGFSSRGASTTSVCCWPSVPREERWRARPRPIRTTARRS